MKNSLLLLFLIFFMGCAKEDAPQLVTSISFEDNELSIKLGESKTLNIIHEPANLQDPSYTWESSNKEIATISNGKITAISIGDVIIKVTAPQLGLTASCKVNVTPIEAETIVLNAVYKELIIGDEFQLTATVEPKNATDKSITWKSSDENVVTVSDDGLVKAINVGKAAITVTSGNISSTCTIEVEPILVTKILLSKENLEVLVGEEFQLTATIEPTSATDKSITWKSSDVSVATVSDNGLVKAIDVGKTTITATSGNISSTCNIEVEPIRVTGISLSQKDLEIELSDEFQLEANIIPDNATNKKITWSSSDVNIATVTDYGLIKANDIGNATINAVSEDGNYTSKVNVTVNLKGIKLSKNDILLAYPDGQYILHVLYSHNDKAYLNATWASENPEIVSVKGDKFGNSALLEAISEGETVITATSVDGRKVASCTVKIEKIKVQEITLNYSYLSLMPNQTRQLAAYIYPDNVYDKKLNWSSSNSNVASISESGLLQTHQTGSTTITVESNDGKVNASCTIDVKDITSYISLSFHTSSIANFLGFITGDLYSVIENSSNETIELTSLYIYDGNTNKLVGYATDPSLLGNLSAGTSTNLGMKFNSVYYPVFVWTFLWDNKEYTIQHQYTGSSTRGTSSEKIGKLNLIEPVIE